MHVLSSTVAVPLGPGAQTWAAASSGLPIDASLAPFGMLQGQILKGMSGGPVMDAQCGVAGIISGFATNSAFAKLDDVDAWRRR